MTSTCGGLPARSRPASSPSSSVSRCRSCSSGAADIDTYSPLEGLFSENVYLALGALLLFAGVGVGLAMLIPGGMGHSAFVREHPYVEDFYTQAQKEEARKHFSWCLVGGIMCILGRRLLRHRQPPTRRCPNASPHPVMLVFIAVGAGLIVYGSMMYGRMEHRQLQSQR